MGWIRTEPSANPHPHWVHFRWAADHGVGHDMPMNSEWIVFVYPLALIGYLMLAARWQPKASRAETRDRQFRTER